MVIKKYKKPESFINQKVLSKIRTLSPTVKIFTTNPSMLI